MHRIGIDLGGTKTELIVTGENPLDVIEKKRVETERSGYQALLKQLEDLVDSVGNLALENPAVGLGAPGFVDPKTGAVGSSNLRPLSFKPFQEDLQKRLGMPVRVVNDANCFALSEALQGRQGVRHGFGDHPWNRHGRRIGFGWKTVVRKSGDCRGMGTCHREPGRPRMLLRQARVSGTLSFWNGDTTDVS